MLEISTNLNHYKPEYRKYLNILLRPFLPYKRFDLFNISKGLIKINDSIENSDICLLPMDWNYYVDFDKLPDAMTMIKEAKKNRKNILIGLGGDYFAELPRDDHIIKMYMSPYKSKVGHNSIASPVIIGDPLKNMQTNTIAIRKWSSLPVIGFCGQTDPNLIISSLKVVKLAWQNIGYFLHFSKYYPGPLMPPTYLRRKLLDLLDQTNKVHTEFIRRDRYQGGDLKNKDILQRIKKEFYCNIQNTDYTLCIRGGGNFSARFYETLALGRIPVFVNTDCMLPFGNKIDWKKHVVWVEHYDIKNTGAIIQQFHHSLNQKSFKQLQQENRLIWEKYFQFSGFYNQLVLHFVKEIK